MMEHRNDLIKENFYMKKINMLLIKIVNDLEDAKNVGAHLKQYLDLLVKIDP